VVRGPTTLTAHLDRRRVRPITVLGHVGGAWLRSQRERYRPEGRPLAEDEEALLAPHFGRSTLSSVRIALVPGSGRPPFYRETTRVALDLAGMSAITLVDTIVVNRRFVEEPLPGALLFHELVHVVQFEALGAEEFARRYVLGWLRGGLSYSAIPLERAACRLQATFQNGTLTGRVVGPMATDGTADLEVRTGRATERRGTGGAG